MTASSCQADCQPRPTLLTRGSRGHETAEHRRWKGLVAACFRQLDWCVFIEKQLCDVVALKVQGGRRRLLGVEVERSRRNVVRNIRRDLSGGCEIVVVVVPDERLRAKVRRLVSRHGLGSRVGITTIAHIERAIGRLQANQHGLNHQ